MFEPKTDTSGRRWLPVAIAAALIAVVFIVGMDSKGLIKMLPFGFAERILDKDLPEHLQQVFPGATGFSKRQTKPIPYFIAYSDTSGSQTVAGYVVRTIELQPDERGYDGPIEMLVGMDLNGKLTGVLVTEQHEPYGYFSVGLPSFARQFKGKDIRDPFRVGGDVAAISRASISVNSASRAIRNSARLAARALLAAQAQDH